MWCQLSIPSLLSFSLGGVSRFQHLKYVCSLSAIARQPNAVTFLFHFHQIKNKTLFYRRYYSKAKSITWRKNKNSRTRPIDLLPESNSSPLIIDVMKKNNSRTHDSNVSVESTPSLGVMKASMDEMNWDFAALKHKKKMIIKTESIASSSFDDFNDDDDDDKFGNTFVEKIVLDEQHKAMKRKVHPLKGSADPNMAVTDIPCSGCGALLHCKDTGIHGYMPSEKLKGLTQDELRTSVCQRCFLLQNYNMCLNVVVNEEELPKILTRIKNETALVLVVIDLFDMRNNIVKELSEHIGHNRPLYIIGNKVDMIPKDETGYLERIKGTLLTECMNSGLLKSEKYCKHICLVSAKTGYGIEELVTKLMMDWELKGVFSIMYLGTDEIS